jgi:tyrosyl-tRNA synthetase
MNCGDPVTIYEQLRAGTHHVIPEAEFLTKLASGKKLRVKLGVDPTAPDLHLGHVVVLSKLRQFQDFGHDIIFLIGDFTARIGDPSGRSKTRPPLSDEQIAFNTETYFKQVSGILDPARVTVRHNGEWLGSLTSKDFVALCSKVTLARIIEREDFANRIAEHQPVGFHELLYPLMQGYDSVVLQSDVELGGTDQTFNLLMGRYLQEQFGQEPQVIMTVPILPGLDGTVKMSKSLGNAIGLNEPVDQAYGKLMSISDNLMWQYYSLLLHKTAAELDALRYNISTGNAHPMELKKIMAHSIVARFWSLDQANTAQQIFEELFQKHDYEHAQPVNGGQFFGKPVWIVELLKYLAQETSSSQVRRLIQEGAVKIDNEKITDVNAQVVTQPGMHIKVGKHRFYKLV